MSGRVSRERFAEIASDTLSKLGWAMPAPIYPPEEFQGRWDDAMWYLFRAEQTLRKIVDALEEDEDA